MLVRSFGLIGITASLLGIAAATPVAGDMKFGPAWISIETPVNPYDPATKDAFLVVHAFHHRTPVAVPVSGTAQGIVNGQRRSVALSFTATTRTGEFALRRQWGDNGIWTLVISVEEHPSNSAQAIVEIGADGRVARIDVPTRAGEGGMLIPRRVSDREIDDALRLRARLAVAQTRADTRD